MKLSVTEETPDLLSEYGKVPIAFRVESQFRLELCQSGLGGMRLVEEKVEPYIKDYDADEKNKPAQWTYHWDISCWGIFAAFYEGLRIGGAAVAWKTPEITLSNTSDIACLWDLRVHPDFRNRGVGHQLFGHALHWSVQRRCNRLMVETQNINVPACHFYARQGFELGAINKYAYGQAMNEVQLLWFRDL